MSVIAMVVTALICLAAGHGAMAAGPYDERMKTLTTELRCLVCQNETLYDSTADLAIDLRRQVQAQMEQGKTDEQIKAYLVERYGDFVLFSPPVQTNTMLLWYGPFGLLLLGGLAWVMIQRRSRSAAQAESRRPGAVDSEARRLLDDERA